MKVHYIKRSEQTKTPNNTVIRIEIMNLRKFIYFIIVVSIFFSAYSKYQKSNDAKRYQRSTLSSYSFKESPEQYELDQASFPFEGFQIKPLASFLVRAHVISRENYSFDTGSALSPLDLVLGWQRMADPKIYETLNIQQSGRWYRYASPNDPPIPLDEIIDSSGNMHMVPANSEVKNRLARVKKGDIIKIKGMLIEATKPDGWRWSSSLSRTDSGAGACELIFVEEVEIESPA